MANATDRDVLKQFDLSRNLVGWLSRQTVQETCFRAQDEKAKKVFDLFYRDNPEVLDFGDCGECDRSTGVKRLHSLSPF